MAKRNSGSDILRAVLAQLTKIEHGDGPALPAEPMPDIVKATAAPAWLTEGKKSVAKTAPKTKTNTSAARWVAIPATYEPPTGGSIPGVRVLKMFGNEVDRRKPYGTFLTLAAAEAIFELLSREPRN